ncbi:MAG: MoaD/ThiS family protein [Roseobacter sp.]
MVEVTLWAGLIPLAGGHKTLSVKARTIRELLRALEDRYPALGPPFKNQVAVVIDGVVFRNDWSQEIPEGAEVFLMRRLSGG